MRGPLEALRVIECGRGTASARVGCLLADYGADVILIEPPGGDPWRSQLVVERAVFARGKRSVMLDLTMPDDREQLLRIIDDADVLVESLSPGVATSLGLDFGRIHDRAPQVVVATISAFGDEYADGVRGYEALVHAVLGTMAEQVGHRSGPIYEALPFASIGAAYLAVIGILAALHRRDDDGCGRRVETSLLDGVLTYMSMQWSDGHGHRSEVAAGASRMVTRTFQCGDGRYLGVHTGAVGAFGRLMELLGFDDRITPSADGLDLGLPLEPGQGEWLHEQLEVVFASKPRDEWVATLTAVDVCAIPALEACEVFDEPQARHNDMVVTIVDPVLGPLEQVGSPIKLSGLLAGPRSGAPLAGEHTQEVLRRGPWMTPRRALAATSIPDTDRPLLAGVKVLDVGAYFAGPYSSRLLADLGAEVIKVEPPHGDQLRGLDILFRSCQAGKRSLAADLKDPDLAAARDSLIRWADVVHHNMRPGAAERLGLGAEHVHAINPKVVYLHAPGWGTSGPNVGRQSFAPLLSGYVGASFECAGQFNAPLFPLGNEDPGNGLLGAIGVLLALLDRNQTGTGRFVANPQLNAAMCHMAHITRTPGGAVYGAGRLDPLQMGRGPLDRLYETADGWICVSAFTDDEIASVGRAVGLDLLGDARFASADARAEHWYALERLLAESFVSITTEDAGAALDREGAPAVVPALVPQGAAIVNDDVHLVSGRTAGATHPRWGTIREVASLVRVSGAGAAMHQSAPGLGEHTDEILAWLGYEDDVVARLRERGAVR